MLSTSTKVSYDSSVRRQMNFTVCPPRRPGSIPSHGGVFQGIFPWLITLCNPISPQWHHTTPNPKPQTPTQSPLNGTTQLLDMEREGRSSTMDRRWLKRKGGRHKKVSGSKKFSMLNQHIIGHAEVPRTVKIIRAWL